MIYTSLQNKHLGSFLFFNYKDVMNTLYILPLCNVVHFWRHLFRFCVVQYLHL